MYVTYIFDYRVYLQLSNSVMPFFQEDNFGIAWCQYRSVSETVVVSLSPGKSSPKRIKISCDATSAGLQLASLRGDTLTTSCQSVASSCGLLPRQTPPGNHHFGNSEFDPKDAPEISCQSSVVDPYECGICLDSLAGVEVQSCGHALCTGCAMQLCEGQPNVPPKCPFCRCTMKSFRVREVFHVVDLVQ
jgi:hypothetical protein